MTKQNTNNIRRKTFVAREDLLNRVVEIAKAHGCSLFELTNELLQLEIDSVDMGLSLKKVVAERKQLESAKNAGFVLGLESIWYDMADIAYEKNKRSALKSWFDAGVWFATRYTTNGGKLPLDEFKSDLSAFTWNAPEFDIDWSEQKISIKVTSPRFTEAYTFLFAAFLSGAMKTFGYKSTEEQFSRGIIRLECVKEVVNGSA